MAILCQGIGARPRPRDLCRLRNIATISTRVRLLCGGPSGKKCVDLLGTLTVGVSKWCVTSLINYGRAAVLIQVIYRRALLAAPLLEIL